MYYMSQGGDVWQPPGIRTCHPHKKQWLHSSKPLGPNINPGSHAKRSGLSRRNLQILLNPLTRTTRTCIPSYEQLTAEA